LIGPPDVRAQVGAFLDGYLIVEGYEMEVERKVQDMYEQTLGGLENAGVDLSDERVDAAVEEALCTYVVPLGGLHLSLSFSVSVLSLWFTRPCEGQLI
jgi:hypothetical protein